MVTSKVLILIVTIVMPGEQPDLNKTYPVKTFEDCWKAAKSFTERDLTDDMRAKGAVGLRAACMYLEKPSEED